MRTSSGRWLSLGLVVCFIWAGTVLGSRIVLGSVRAEGNDGPSGARVHAGGSRWVSEPVDTVGMVGRFASLALDPDGKPMIAYNNDTGNDLRTAALTGSTWLTTTVRETSEGPSLSIDITGTPHLVYTFPPGWTTRLSMGRRGRTRLSESPAPGRF